MVLSKFGAILSPGVSDHGETLLTNEIKEVGSRNYAVLGPHSWALPTRSVPKSLTNNKRLPNLKAPEPGWTAVFSKLVDAVHVGSPISQMRPEQFLTPNS